MIKTFTNPIIPGFSPDASVLRVDDDYYLTTSTFEWWPGIEIYHSKDLVNWKVIDNPLTRMTQADLRGNYNSGSIWAPHLSFAENKFWLIYTNVKTTGAYKDTLNYVITADNIGGRWSEPTFATTAATQYPLLLHYHPLMIYRHRVNKQADTLLAEMLFPEDQSQEQLARDYDYYEPITTHDSSLSRSIFSILASRLDRRDKAYNYYMDTSLMDLVDLQGNAKDGLHEANLGGSWLGLTYGFAGMYVAAGKLHITNHLPQEINQLSYRLRFRGRVLEVQLTQGSTQVQVVSGTPLMIVVDGREVEVTSKTVANG